MYPIHYALIKHKIFKKVISDKINGTKIALFFLSRAPSHDSFNFNLQLLYGLKHSYMG